MLNSPRKGYISLGQYTPDYVFAIIAKGNGGKFTPNDKSSIAKVDGHKLKANSFRYEVFKNSLICACCGIKGEVFLLERFKNNEIEKPHFNLYAYGDGLVLMTKDHIIPKSKGGKNIMSNFQTMCQPCNSKKGSKV